MLNHVAEIIPAPARLTAPLTLPARAPLLVQRFDLDPVTSALALPGEHNRLNASAASAVARCFDVDEAEIASAWRKARPVPMRFDLIAAEDSSKPTIINDAYNANPTSMRAALELLATYPEPRWAVLGDMLELGDAAPAAHRAMAMQAATICSRCFLIGPNFVAVSKPEVPAACNLSTHLAWSEALATQIATELSANATILIKGSRGMALERLLPFINAQFDSAPRRPPARQAL